MKVIHYTKYYPPQYNGGIEKVTFDLVSGLKGNKVDAVVLCNGNKNETVSEPYLKVVFIKPFITLFKMPISFLIFVKLFKESRNANVLHVHLPNPLAMVYSLLISIFFKDIILIAHWHSDIVKQKKLLNLVKPLQNIFLSKCSSIIVTSPTYAKSSTCLTKFSHKLSVIPIGVDVNGMIVNEDFKAKLVKKYSGKKIVFSLGRLTYYKGFEYLINSAKLLPEDVIILIGGIGEDFDKLSNLIISNNLGSKVELLGGIPFSDLPSYFDFCDIFCLPSIARSEAFGVVQVEAMSFSKPIISSDIAGSGVGWVNKDLESGLLVNPKDSIQIADAIINLISNVDLYNKLSLGAKNRFDEIFNVKTMNIKVLDLYKSLLANKVRGDI